MSFIFLFILNNNFFHNFLFVIYEALLSLGIKGIYLGPTLPAFLSPNVLQYLVDTFDLRLISTPDDDLKSCLEQGI